MNILENLESTKSLQNNDGNLSKKNKRVLVFDDCNQEMLQATDIEPSFTPYAINYKRD